MYTKIQVVFDAAEPERLGPRFRIGKIRLKPETAGGSH